MASMMCLPRVVHLNLVFQMFSFLKNKNNGVTFFYPNDPEIDQAQFPTEDGSATTYGSCKEDFPSNAPMTIRTGFTMRSFLSLIKLGTRLLVSRELALSCSSIALLSLFVQRSRGFLKHGFLLLSLLQ